MRSDQGFLRYPFPNPGLNWNINPMVKSLLKYDPTSGHYCEFKYMYHILSLIFVSVKTSHKFWNPKYVETNVIYSLGIILNSHANVQFESDVENCSRRFNPTLHVLFLRCRTLSIPTKNMARERDCSIVDSILCSEYTQKHSFFPTMVFYLLKQRSWLVLAHEPNHSSSFKL